MKLHELAPTPGARKDRFRVGRGLGSGNGKTSGKGHKGQKARSGGGVRTGFEGGQMPLYRRLPKRGFKNVWAKVYSEVNVESLKRFNDGDIVDAVSFIEVGVLKNVRDGVRVLGKGEISTKLTVIASGFSKSAAEKIKAAGGKVLDLRDLDELDLEQCKELRAKLSNALDDMHISSIENDGKIDENVKAETAKVVDSIIEVVASHQKDNEVK